MTSYNGDLQNRNAIAAQQLFRLVFMDVHSASPLAVGTVSTSCGIQLFD